MNNKHYYNFKYVKGLKDDYEELGINLPNIVDVCDEAVERIASDEGASISRIINEVAQSNVDIYTSSLYSNSATVSFEPFINESIAVFGLPEANDNFLSSLFSQAQEIYFHRVLSKNIDTIIGNSLAEKLQTEMLMIECTDDTYYELEDKLYNFTSKYFEEVELNDRDRLDEVLDDFYEELQDEINKEKEVVKFKKLSDDPDDQDFMIRGLLIEPSKEPRPILISKQNELAELQHAVGGYIDIHTIQNRYNHQLYDIVLNDEGKCIGLPFNFPLYNHYQGISEDGVYDAIVGTAILFKENGSELGSLDENEIEFWKRELRLELLREGISLGASLLDSGEPSQWDLSYLSNGDDETHTDYQHQNRDDDLEL